MPRTLCLVLVCLGILSGACTAPQPMEQNTSPAAAPVKSGTIRIEVPADADVADIPWLMAIDSLKEQGYSIETVSLSSDLSAAAMAEGDLDIANLSNQHAWAAIGQGAPLMTFMDKSASTFMLLAPKAIQTCADLDGRPVASNGVSTVAGALLNAYLEKNCPDAKPQILVVKGGSNRTATLLSGEVDAAIQDIDDLIKLELDRPGEFQPLVVFAEASPGVQINSHVTGRQFADQHPEMVKDFIKAVLAARRTLQDSEALHEAIIKYVEFEPDRAQQAADTYLEQAVWDASGTYTLETVQTTLGFLQEYGDLPKELTAEDVADLSYYDAVLDEMGDQ